MRIYYSKSTRGFYNDDVNGDSIPADALEITNQEHESLMNAQSSGKVIVPDNDGMPIAADQPEPTQEQLKMAAKAELMRIDKASIRSLREWLAAQPGAPQFIIDHELAAVAERAKLQ